MKTNKNQEKNKQKRLPTIKVGRQRKLTVLLWILLIGSVSFGIYKNFTAIDTHTIHEKEIIKSEYVDTSAIESFTKSFAYEYFSWGQTQKEQDFRKIQLAQYLTDELLLLNEETIRTDIPTSAKVQEVQIWNVMEKEKQIYEVLFSVQQLITKDKEAKTVLSAYHLQVFVDKDESMVIITNPTIDRVPIKSDFQPKAPENDGTLNAPMIEELNDFLATFFKLYPTASEKELSYYVRDGALPTIEKEYVFAELINPIYLKEDEKIIAKVTVKYLDQETNAVQLSQYELKLEHGENWLIVK
jgi:hypothetical protein